MAGCWVHVGHCSFYTHSRGLSWIHNNVSEQMYSKYFGGTMSFCSDPILYLGAGRVIVTPELCWDSFCILGEGLVLVFHQNKPACMTTCRSWGDALCCRLYFEGSLRSPFIKSTWVTVMDIQLCLWIASSTAHLVCQILRIKYLASVKSCWFSNTQATSLWFWRHTAGDGGLCL